MKLLKALSIIFALVLVVLLVIANIFHKDIRRMVMKNYQPIFVDNSSLNKLKQKTNPDYIFEINSEKKAYYPYEKIKIFGRIIKKKGVKIPKSAVIKIKLRNGSLAIKNIQGNDTLTLRYNPKQNVWVGNYFTENSCILGTITIEAHGYVDNPESPLYTENTFIINEYGTRHKIEKGLAFIGIDSKERISKRGIWSPNQKELGWSVIPDWVKFVSADGIFMLGGITETFDESANFDNPWKTDIVNEAIKLAERVSANGNKFGVWIKALGVEGSYLERIGYKPTLYLKENSYAKDTFSISIDDENRKTHIKLLMNKFMNNNSIKYVGLSHIFNSTGYDLELYERFVNEFQVDVPSNWKNMNDNHKLQYFINRMKNPSFYEQFYRWRNFVISKYIKELINSSDHRKSIFYYASADELEKNPQMISILFNSGIDFVVLNFYMKYKDIDKTFEKMRNNNSIGKYQNKIIFSYEVNFNNVDTSDYETSAIENYVNANLKIAKLASKNFNYKGILINDLYKAMIRNRGPYHPYACMLGVGKTVYKFQDYNEDIPLKVNSFAYITDKNKRKVVVRIKGVNASLNTLNNISISLSSVKKSFEEQKRTISKLEPGHEFEFSIPITFVKDTSHFVRKKYFIGVHSSWDGGKRGTVNSFLDFVTVKNFTEAVSTNK